jgi:hypothetical protein
MTGINTPDLWVGHEHGHQRDREQRGVSMHTGDGCGRGRTPVGSRHFRVGLPHIHCHRRTMVPQPQSDGMKERGLRSP